MSELDCKDCFALGQQLELARQRIMQLEMDIELIGRQHARDIEDTKREMEREHNQELREAMAEARYEAEAEADMGWPHG